MAEQPQGFARRMMAQKLMADARNTPGSDSPFFAGRIRPSMADIEQPTRFSDMAMPAYSTGATASLFAPGAGVADIFGGAPDPMQPGQMLPSFGENIGQGNYLDAGLQTLGAAGDVALAAGALFPPALPGAMAVGTALKAPRAAKVADAAMDAADAAKIDPNQAAGAAMDLAQARYFETGKFEPPTAENPVSVVLPTETEPGIIAFHGSGADFDEFRLEMIGTGEGAQAYGYGLYFTDSEDIARFYKETVGQERNQIQFKGKPLDSVYTADIYENFGDDISQIIKKAKEMGVAGGDEEIIEDAVIGVFANLSQGLSNMKDAQTAVDSLRSGRSTGFSPEKTIYRFFIEPEVKEADIPEGKMYKVALSPKPDELLDYDLPIGNQSPDIKEKISKLIDNEITPDDLENFGSPRGDLKASLLSENRTVVSFLNDFAAIRGKDNAGEELLAKYGIPGIKYFDNTSRNTAGGKLIDITEAEDGFRAKVAVENRPGGLGGSGRIVTTSAPYKTRQEALDWAEEATKRAERNYVIFDDKAVKILEKYGIAGPVLVTGAAVAASKAGNDNEDGGSILPDAGII